MEIGRIDAEEKDSSATISLKLDVVPDRRLLSLEGDVARIREEVRKLMLSLETLAELVRHQGHQAELRHQVKGR